MQHSLGQDGAWYAIHTKPKQEERAARNLTAWNIKTFLPIITTSYLPQHKEPLFPGYIFAYFDIHRYLYKLQFTRGIAHIVSFGGQPAVVGLGIIDALQGRVNANHQPEASGLKTGDKVLIQSGTLGDLVGIFEREVPGHERVRVLLTTLSHTARIEVPSSQVSIFNDSASRKAV